MKPQPVYGRLLTHLQRVGIIENIMVSRQTAVNHLKILFSDPSKEEITAEEMFAAGNRSGGDNPKNRMWLRHEMWIFREYGLAEAVLAATTNGVYIASVRLTEEGKRALREPDAWPRPGLGAPRSRKASMPSVAELMDQLAAWQETHGQEIVVDIPTAVGTVSVRLGQKAQSGKDRRHAHTG
jgi:hypothetical protein